ncbi:hypothetical protein GCK32_018746 [Trichostrongylus colubriformis]|uniref:Uncharacterized protein n=1 Tax=Trichostrongylus colubriformis TaxID=6319 RepID=A0AAN8IFM6_TRICO
MSDGHVGAPVHLTCVESEVGTQIWDTTTDDADEDILFYQDEFGDGHDHEHEVVHHDDTKVTAIPYYGRGLNGKRPQDAPSEDPHQLETDKAASVHEKKTTEEDARPRWRLCCPLPHPLPHTLTSMKIMYMWSRCCHKSTKQLPQASHVTPQKENTRALKKQKPRWKSERTWTDVAPTPPAIKEMQRSRES